HLCPYHPSTRLPPASFPTRRSSDLNVGDVLPYVADDERLEHGYEATDDEEADRIALWELGLGRPRVLSPEGRSEAAQRWYDGDQDRKSTRLNSSHVSTSYAVCCLIK